MKDIYLRLSGAGFPNGPTLAPSNAFQKVGGVIVRQRLLLAACIQMKGFSTTAGKHLGFP